MTLSSKSFALLTLLSLWGCDGTEVPAGLSPAVSYGGPVVVFDLFAKPLPELPLPNDIATRPDPSALTGRRINASVIAPTEFERTLRDELDRLDGWGTTAPISVSFEPVEQLIDMGNILRRHSRDRYEFSDDALYVINIDPDSPNFGLPHPLDLGEGSFPWTVGRDGPYFENDPRPETNTALFETTYEDTNGNGRLDSCEDRDQDGVADEGEDLDGDGRVFSAERDEDGDGRLDPEEDLNGNGRLDCSEDTDFDGHLDVPNLYCGADPRGRRIPPWQCPDVSLSTDGDDVVIPARDAWLTTWYEQETNTLLLQPLIPLEEQTTYAVVLTKRLVDEEGRPVGSPFEAIHHVDQARELEQLPRVFAEHSDVYGGLTVADIQFAWTFTTQSITADLHNIREGLYGRGPLAALSEEFPPELTVDRIHGCSPGSSCRVPDNPYIIQALDDDGNVGLMDIVSGLLMVVDVDLGEIDYATIDRIMESYDVVDYFAHFRFQAPNFLESDDASEDVDKDGRLDLVDEDVNGNGRLDADEDLDLDGHLDIDEDRNGNLVLDDVAGRFAIDLERGVGPHGAHTVTGFVAVPRPDPDRGIEPPFPVVVYSHGYDSLRFESLLIASYMARHGLATVAIDAVHSGIPLDAEYVEYAETIFDSLRLVPFAEALLSDRAEDLDGDGIEENGVDVMTADVVHSRDVARQTVVDTLRLIHVLRGFDGERRWSQDLDGDGEPELAGDFNADGVVDLGGELDYYATGNSLGGMFTTNLAALEPAVVAAAPVSAGSALTSTGFRTKVSNIRTAVALHTMGPLLVTSPASSYQLMPCTGDHDCPGGGCVAEVCRCSQDDECQIDEASYQCSAAPAGLADDGPVCMNREATACEMEQISVRFVFPNFNVETALEVACLDDGELRNGDTLVARNLANGEADCFIAGAGGRSRLHLPADRFDPVELRIYEGDVISEAPCILRPDVVERRVVDTFERDVSFQSFRWINGSPLLSPATGLGLKRATPELRRFAAIGQVLIERADPANYARNLFVQPLPTYEAEPTSFLSISTIGDTEVPISGGIAIARAAGILEFSRVDPRLTDEDHPDGMSPDRYLIDSGVIAGTHRLSPYRRTLDGRQVLFDPDDFDREGTPPSPDWQGDGLGAPTGDVPLRLWRPIVPGETCTCVDILGESPCQGPEDTTGPVDMVLCPSGVAALGLAYFDIEGAHALRPVMNDLFDTYAFSANMIGRFFATGGTELRWNLCMADNTCTEEEDGFFTPSAD